MVTTVLGARVAKFQEPTEPEEEGPGHAED